MLYRIESQWFPTTPSCNINGVIIFRKKELLRVGKEGKTKYLLFRIEPNLIAAYNLKVVVIIRHIARQDYSTSTIIVENSITDAFCVKSFLCCSINISCHNSKFNLATKSINTLFELSTKLLFTKVKTVLYRTIVTRDHSSSVEISQDQFKSVARTDPS